MLKVTKSLMVGLFALGTVCAASRAHACAEIYEEDPGSEGSPADAAGDPVAAGAPLAALMVGVYASRWSTGEPREVRIDPPGLLDSWAILGVSQGFWQYQRHNLILFERGGR
ncbi:MULTISPECIES: hypothetical protein [Sorangium]|uniref:hypothetical protein n=1 Tax=Sorangium TaxID=39643 RepID=UPI00101A888B|nr:MULTISPECIES: hypothetical protein [Sorangium]WCQ92634.1 hypothetical protein NQZ70_05377 [Sorangium sp. Soce836]